jgi:hypothetical protein
MSAFTKDGIDERCGEQRMSQSTWQCCSIIEIVCYVATAAF